MLPSPLHPVPNRLGWDAGFFGPLRKIFSNAASRKLHVPARVICLLLHFCPNAILWEIPGIIVHPFDTPPRRRVAHVLRECPDVVPPLADRDSSAAVAGEESSVRIQASGEHFSPYSTDSGSAEPMLPFNAPAGDLATAGEVPDINLGMSSAVACANPVQPSERVFYGVKSNHLPESLPFQVSHPRGELDRSGARGYFSARLIHISSMCGFSGEPPRQGRSSAPTFLHPEMKFNTERQG